MLKFYQKFQEAEGEQSGGSSSEPKADGKEADSKDDSGSQKEGDNFDEFGYEKSPEAKGDQKPDGKADKEPKQDPTAEPPKVDKPVSGYSSEPKKVEEAPPPEQKPEKIDLGYELDLKGLDEENSKFVQEFAKNSGLSKEQAEAFVALRKKEVDEATAIIAEQKKNLENARNNQRVAWYKELKDDKTFGGAGFDRNVARVEQVLEEHLPLTKKALTERGTVLPPNVMKDLLGIWEKLYATHSPMQGEPPVGGKPKDDKTEDPLDFYNS